MFLLIILFSFVTAFIIAKDAFKEEKESKI